MQSRKRRPTFDVVVRNIPKHVTQREAEKKFIAYGEVSCFYYKPQPDGNKEAVIGYLCEPDADKAVDEYNGFQWEKNTIIAKRRHHKNVSQPNNPSHRQPFYKPAGMSNLRNVPPMNINMFPPPYPNFSNPSYHEMPYRYPPQVMNFQHRRQDTKGMTGNYDRKKNSPKQKQEIQNKNVQNVEHHNTLNFSSGPDIREIQVTYVENCVTFYGQCVSKFHAYEDMSSRMQRLCPSLPVVKCIPTVGELYGAVYSGDNQWYRCKILMNNTIPGQSRVQYVDFGNSECVEFRGIVELPKSIIAEPYFAPKCTFVTVEAVANGKVANEGCNYLQEYILGKVVNVHTYSAMDNPVYEVIECYLNGSDVIRDIAKSRYVAYRKVPQASPAILAEQSAKTKSVSSPTSIVDTKNQESGDNKTKFNFPKSNKNASVHQHHNKGTTSAKMKTDKKVISEGEFQYAIIEKEKMAKEVQTLKNKVTTCQQKCKELEKRLKEKEAEAVKYHVLKQMETVASHVQLANSIRCSPQTSDLDICSALAMLIRINDPSTREKQKLQETISDMLAVYNQLLSDIKQCSCKATQDELIDKKNSLKDDLCDNLKKYESLYELSKNDMVDIDHSAMQEMVKKLKPKEKSTSDMILNNEPSTIDGILLEYETMMVSKNERMAKVRKEADAVLADFQSVLSDFIKSFSLYNEDISVEDDAAKKAPFMAEGILTSDRFKKSLDALQNALENEMKALYVERDFKDNTKCTLVQCLIKELQNVEKRENKEKLLVRKYHIMATDLSDDALFPPKLADLLTVRQGIKAIKSKLRHALVDKKDLEEGDHSDRSEIDLINSDIQEFRKALHLIYNQEDDLLKQLSKLCTTNFPEFELQHPELNLETYRKYEGLYKQNWELEEFNCEKVTDRGSMCYEAMFGEHPVIIKEFLLDCEDKSTILLEKVMQWHSLSSDCLVPIWAVFKKGDRQMFVMMPRQSTLLDQIGSLSKSESYDILTSVLKSIHTLHKNDIVHGCIDLLTVLVDEKEVSLDFCFRHKYLTSVLSSKDLKFQSPEILRGNDPCKASDMFSFGCLLLALLVPDIPLFCKSPRVTLDLSPYQKEIKEALSQTGCSTVSALIQQQAHKRPTAEFLLQGRFPHIFIPSDKLKVNQPTNVVNKPTNNVSDEAAEETSDSATNGVNDVATDKVSDVVADGVTDAVADLVSYLVSNVIASNVSDWAADGDVSDVATGGVSNVTAGDVSNVAAGDVSDVAAGDVSDVAAGDVSDVAAGDVSDVAAGDVSDVAAGDVSDVAAGDVSDVAAGDVSDVAAGDGSDVAAADGSNVATGGVSNVATGGVSNVATGGVSNVATGGASNVATGGVNNISTVGVSDWAADNASDITADGVSDVGTTSVSNTVSDRVCEADRELTKATNVPDKIADRVNDTNFNIAGPSVINTEIMQPESSDLAPVSSKANNALAKLFALREPLVRSTNSNDISSEKENPGEN